MTQQMHTPGPWSVEDPMGAKDGLWIVQEGLKTYEWSCIAMVQQDDRLLEPGARFITPDEQKANAHLISSAPELLAALNTLVAAMGCHDTTPEEFNALTEARAAIAKAEGSRP